MDELDDKFPTSPMASRLRFLKQQSTDSIGSSVSHRSHAAKPSRMATVRKKVRQTIKGKKNQQSRQDKMLLKRNEFLQYLTRHIKELEGAIEYFRKGF